MPRKKIAADTVTLSNSTGAALEIMKKWVRLSCDPNNPGSYERFRINLTAILNKAVEEVSAERNAGDEEMG